ncbi:hypothetical protein FRX31_034171 [Thalictrum thalictroides]|uniref:Uncharacterized protein n=1 Tax=Thalictrum thalictroides TaxID=46969 RepID=A0A7J6UVK3_THATH|nr:hypothetical protein FRX31_034171 [Thalictrum thalictroides]
MEWRDPVTESVFHARFDAYNAWKRSEFVNNCNRCAWVARQDGIYHSPLVDQWQDDSKLIYKWGYGT